MPISPLPGVRLWIRHRKSWPSSSGVGTLNAETSQPCGLNASMTLRIVPSLPAASMPWRTTSTDRFASAQRRSWRLGQAVQLVDVTGAADALSNPNVASGSSFARRTREPGLTRGARLAGRSVGAWQDLVATGGTGTGCTMPTVPERSSDPMAIAAATQPHPIFLAGRWVESPEVLVDRQPGRRRRRRPAPPTTRPRRSTRRRSRPPSRPSR